MSVPQSSSVRIEAVAGGPSRLARLATGAALAIPFVFVVAFFFVPMIVLIGMSLSSHEIGSAPRLTFTLSNFAEYWTDPFYLRTSLWTTVKLAILSTLFALVIGYVLAYYIAELPAKKRGLITSLVVVSLTVNIVIRVFGLNVLLASSGLINTALQAVGLTERPIRLTYSELGVLIGLVQIAVPYIVLPLIGVLSAIDPALREAAQSVGANRFRTFWNVTLPLSMPGVIAGTLIVFTLNAAAFAIPAMMGGGRVRMMGMLAYQQATISGNFPFAAAVGLSLAALTLVITVAYLYLINRKFKAVR